MPDGSPRGVGGRRPAGGASSTRTPAPGRSRRGGARRAARPSGRSPECRTWPRARRASRASSRPTSASSGPAASNRRHGAASCRRGPGSVSRDQAPDRTPVEGRADDPVGHPADLLARHPGGEHLRSGRRRGAAPPGGCRPARRSPRPGRGRPGAVISTIAGPGLRLGVDDEDVAGGRPGLGGEIGQRLVGQGVADLAGLGVADQHLVGDRVGAAGAGRVVGAVGDQPLPGDVEERRGRGPFPRRAEQRQQRLGPALHRPLGGGGRRPDVDPVGDDARQQRRPGRRPQLAPPERQGAGREASARWSSSHRARSATSKRYRRWSGVGLGHGPGHRRLGRALVAAVHQQQPADPAPGDLGLPAPGPRRPDRARPAGGPCPLA